MITLPDATPGGMHQFFIYWDFLLGQLSKRVNHSFMILSTMTKVTEMRGSHTLSRLKERWLINRISLTGLTMNSALIICEITWSRMFRRWFNTVTTLQ